MAEQEENDHSFKDLKTKFEARFATIPYKEEDLANAELIATRILSWLTENIHDEKKVKIERDVTSVFEGLRHDYAVSCFISCDHLFDSVQPEFKAEFMEWGGTFMGREGRLVNKAIAFRLKEIFPNLNVYAISTDYKGGARHLIQFFLLLNDK